MASEVFLQTLRLMKSYVALFASILARRILVQHEFVLLHIAFLRKLLLAPVYVARVRLRKCVRDAVLLCFMLRTKSSVAFVASERPFVGVFAAKVLL